MSWSFNYYLSFAYKEKQQNKLILNTSVPMAVKYFHEMFENFHEVDDKISLLVAAKQKKQNF